MTELTPDQLMTQAKTTADEYMRAAVENIDKLFGHGYAKDHPELIAAFMSACTHDFDTAMQYKNVGRLYNVVSDVSSAIDCIADCLEAKK